MYVSGTTAMNEKGETIGKNVYEQTIYCFEKIKKVLGYGGFSKKDVVLIKAYLVNMKDIGRFDKVFINRFFDIKPGCTLVGIKELVKPNLLVEVECIAEKNL
ncbi:hypothetical protein A2774_05885 [Candidatus Roizmanbacteria bacterium RIFCSPHIGHO2_01_FULL_39_12c]|uniref:Enamine deaminase RidA n=1 Tax=Candidatus Roizmanbacteria bacterium RIFCSPHIGHO2_01_FULL_39_12c TaxID=1802031 RepID=A0A1F7GAA9_9BACT|nr:MAG: hypothetical protein A2774_05885 [Candidatus Roizmanbacteria bacterium RIFCSPHIGHO2_01_FULL_39_12c]OGK46463.1 MAG: hypothetical protein A2963_01700 [Candidatus Roizmanbacteria bacterium RIFCSPLOWO2_01_FULL_40_13]